MTIDRAGAALCIADPSPAPLIRLQLDGALDGTPLTRVVPSSDVVCGHFVLDAVLRDVRSNATLTTEDRLEWSHTQGTAITIREQ
jgi:hypothetical protein